MPQQGRDPTYRPWTVTLYERAPVSTPVVAVGLALLHMLVLVALVLATGRYFETPIAQAPWAAPGAWSELVNSVLIGLGPTILVASLRGTERDARDLAPLLGASDSAVRRATELDRGRMAILGALIALGAGAFAYYDPSLWTSRPRPAASDPFLFWHVGRQLVLGWIWARAIYVDLRLARRFGTLAEELTEIDLLDPRSLTPFARHGVRSVLFWMSTLAIFSLFWAAPNSGEANWLPFLIFASVAAAGLLRPLLAIRRRIRAAKDESLARIRGEIRAGQRALLDGGEGAQGAAARLPALFAAEARTVSVREWPFDGGAVARVAFYALIGLGSWVGGALVERLVGAALE